jgi:meso-butanediol dehydrogenase/(S,S)-butanediol dehydrogenase/diacetyl reductase
LTEIIDCRTLAGMAAALENKVCVVTGAARSIGLAVAERYAADGAKLALLDIDPAVESEAARIAAGARSAAGRPALGYVVDVSDRGAVLACFADLVERLGPVYCLVNNAGLVDQRPFEQITPEQMDRIMRVNVHGTLYCVQAAVPSMRTLKEGRIINFSSKSGKTGSALMAHYSAAKGAIIAMTHALAFELAEANIKVNCVCPGLTDATGVWSELARAYVENLKLPRQEVEKRFTAKIPLGRLARMEDVVDFVHFLTVSADYCTGQAFNITGGREVH